MTATQPTTLGGATPTTAPGSGSQPATLRSAASDYWRRVRGGDMGSLPGLGAIVVLVVIFSLRSDSFLTPFNFASLIHQGAAVMIIAMGLIFVLLVGEIDLSAGFTSGLCAALMAVQMTEKGWPWYAAVLLAVVTGAVIGSVLGLVVSKVRVPSFVVTLAAFLAFQGLLLRAVHEGQIIRVSDPTIVALNTKELPLWMGWTLLGVGVGVYALVQFRRAITRSRRGLVSDSLGLVAVRAALLLALGAVATYELSVERSLNPAIISLKGVPIVVLLVLVLLVVLTFVLRRTTFGLHLYAVGGNAEAARRAGMAVDWLRMSAFVICSTVAAIGGIVASSRAQSVDGNSGGSNVLLYAVGAAVIGGTSLFGGRGRVVDAVLGGAVVAIINNGMSLLQAHAWVTYVVTGSVLLVAATVDALSRRRSINTGIR
jgi:D-xylose transport system permease protein